MTTTKMITTKMVMKMMLDLIVLIESIGCNARASKSSLQDTMLTRWRHLR